MRPLRHCWSTSRAPQEPRPVEPVAVLASVGRPEPAFDEGQEFDRAFFGIDADAARSLGPSLPHLVEVVYEALELSGVRFQRLGMTRCAWVHAAEPGDPVALDAAARLLGLEATTVSLAADGDALLCLALHHAAQLLRAGDVDLAVASSRWERGFGAVLLGRTDRAATEQWRVRCVVSGSAAGGDDPERVWQDANARAGLGADVARPAPSHGTRGLLEAVAWLEQEDGSGFTIDGRVSGQEIRVVLGVAEPTTGIGATRPEFLGFSARSLPSLAGVVRASLDVARDDDDLARLAVDAARRPAFEHRLAVPATGWAEVRSRLEQWLAGIPGTVSVGDADEPGVVFVIPPAGVQRVGMGDRLYASEPTFRDALLRCDRASRSVLPRALLSVLYPGPDRDAGAVDDPIFANPLTFALAWSLSELYRSKGVEPVAVVGGGVGELCAAAIAGAVDLEEALRLSVERGRLLATKGDAAAWAAVGATEEQARTLLDGEEEADVVALPAPGRVVIGGSGAAVDRVLERAKRAGLRSAVMPGGPVHSPLVDDLLPPWQEATSKLAFSPTDVPVVSTVTGRRLATAGPEHWVATLRAPLRLASAFEAAWEAGGRTFLELSPRPTLLGAGRQTLEHQPARWLAALDPGVDDRRQLSENLAALWARGAGVEASNGSRPPGGASLPTYAFDRRPLADEWLAEHTEDSGAEPATYVAPQGQSWMPSLVEAEPVPTVVPPEEEVPEPTRLVPPPSGASVPPPWPLRTPTLLPDNEVDGADDLGAPRMPWSPEPAGGDGALLEDGTTWEKVNPPSDLLEIGRKTVRPHPLRPMPDLPDEEPSVSIDSEPMAEVTIDEPTPLRASPSRPPPREVDPTAPLLAPEGPVFQAIWRERPLAGEAAELERSTFVLLLDQRGIGAYVATLLEQAGHRVIRAEVNPVDRSGALRVPDPGAEEAWVEVLDALGTVEGPVHVLHLWTLDGEESVGASMGWPSVVSLAQELLAQGLPTRIHLVTRGAAGEGAAPAAAVGAGLWGVAGLLAAESSLFGGIVDLDPDDEDPELLTKHLLDVLGSGEAPGWWLLRGGKRLLRTVGPASAEETTPAVPTDGTWLVLGEPDGVTLEVARWLVARGVKRMYLVAPGAPAPEVLKAVLEFQKQGTACIVVRADAADAKGADQIRQRLTRESRVAGAFLRFAPTPRTLRDLVPSEELPRWLSGVAAARLASDLVGPTGPVWVWAEGSALDAAPGGGVTALAAAATEAVVLARPASAVVHSAPHTTMGLKRTLDLVTSLAGRGGRWGLGLR